MLAQFAKYLTFWGEGEGLLTGRDDPNTPIIILTLPNLFLLSTPQTWDDKSLMGCV